MAGYDVAVLGKAGKHKVAGYSVVVLERAGKYAVIRHGGVILETAGVARYIGVILERVENV